MGLLSLIGLVPDLAKPIEAISNLYTTDKARILADTAYLAVQERPGLAQLANNSIMAASKSFFCEAWQPLVGWTAGLCFALYYVPQLIVVNLVWAAHVLGTGHIDPFPIDPSNLLHLLYLLFGFGGYNIARQVFQK